MYRHFPTIFKIGYQFLENNQSFYSRGTLTDKSLSSGAKKLSEYIKNNGYDTVICTHPFSTIMLTSAILKYNLKVKTAFVATDYTCAPTVDAKGLDIYFVPDPTITNAFTKYGIDENKIIPTGIPVRQMFYNSLPKEDAKALEGIKKDNVHLLVMCGSMGCGPINKIIKKIANKLPKNAEVTVVCGTNKKLEKSLNKKHQKNRKIHIKGFVKNMSELLDSADLYLTKPGGLSVSEARQKNLPMVFINAVAGCEEHNRRFFMNLGTAVCGDSLKELEEKCLELLNNTQEIKKMSDILSSQKKTNVAETIREHLTK
jgi:processive 1,2-diacylglycerol beta-glucosyltransferase